MKSFILSLCFLSAAFAAQAQPATTKPNISNIQTNNNVQTGNYAARAADCYNPILFNLTAQATLTIGAGAGFPANCDIIVRNIGSYTGPSTARGVLLSVSGLGFASQDNVVFPGQSTVFSNSGASSAWVETGFSQRQLWKPTHTVTFYADASAGSDAGTSDGLGTGAGANATVNAAFLRATDYVDYSGIAQAIVSTTGTFPSGDIVHMAGPPRGGQGNSALVWNGNGTTTMTGSPCLALFDHAWLEISGVACTDTTGSGCFSAQYYSHIFFVTSASTCTTTSSGIVLSATNFSIIEFLGVNLNVAQGSSSAGYLEIASNNSVINFNSSAAVNFTTNMGFTDVLLVQEQSSVSYSGAFALNGHTITGTRFSCLYWSAIFGTSNAPNTFIPGNANGTVGSDCEAP